MWCALISPLDDSTGGVNLFALTDWLLNFLEFSGSCPATKYSYVARVVD